MKLQNEMNYVTEQFKKIKDKIKPYAEKLKAAGGYNDFETRLAWDCLHAVVPCNVICSWYDKYNCNDSHITTLAKVVLKQFYQVIK